jgi:uncharacterized protein (TIGR02118 family)
MIKISVMYPSSANATFDHDYYRDRHMKMVQNLFGSACLHYTIDRGLGSAVPGNAPPFVAMCHIYSESTDVFQAAMSVHGEEINADIVNYTNIMPVIQISEAHDPRETLAYKTGQAGL